MKISFTNETFRSYFEFSLLSSCEIIIFFFLHIFLHLLGTNLYTMTINIRIYHSRIYLYRYVRLCKRRTYFLRLHTQFPISPEFSEINLSIDICRSKTRLMHLTQRRCRENIHNRRNSIHALILRFQFVVPTYSGYLAPSDLLFLIMQKNKKCNRILGIL